ncbi:hypothetical protein TcYC6_0085240 [Trypanosoma cruzi]|nr:hypothetical protein TcYC6_0085240 [Trypanosoma cruzi]
MMTGRVLCVLLAPAVMCNSSCVFSTAAATVCVRPAGDGAVTAEQARAVMAADGGPWPVALDERGT